MECAWGDFVNWTAAEQSNWWFFFQQMYIYPDFCYNLSTLGLKDSRTNNWDTNDTNERESKYSNNFVKLTSPIVLSPLILNLAISWVFNTFYEKNCEEDKQKEEILKYSPFSQANLQ